MDSKGPNAADKSTKASRLIMLSLSIPLRHIQLTIIQTERLTKTANEALSLYHISNNSTAYVPIGHLPELLPSFVSVDQRSKWSVSAFQSMAFESMTLPTRVKNLHSTERSTLDGLATDLNADESQKISQLTMNLPDTLQMNGHHTSHSVAREDKQRDQDCEFAFTNRDPNIEPHLFAQLEHTRGEADHEIELDERERPRIKRYGTGF